MYLIGPSTHPILLEGILEDIDGDNSAHVQAHHDRQQGHGRSNTLVHHSTRTKSSRYTVCSCPLESCQTGASQLRMVQNASSLSRVDGRKRIPRPDRSDARGASGARNGPGSPRALPARSPPVQLSKSHQSPRNAPRPASPATIREGILCAPGLVGSHRSSPPLYHNPCSNQGSSCSKFESREKAAVAPSLVRKQTALGLGSVARFRPGQKT